MCIRDRGTGEEAAAAEEADYIPFTEDAEGFYKYLDPSLSLIHI